MQSDTVVLLPNFIYELVPGIYLGLGIYTWIKLDTVFAMVSGTMLFGAGIAVFLMRQTSRYQKHAYRINQ